MEGESRLLVFPYSHKYIPATSLLFALFLLGFVFILHSLCFRSFPAWSKKGEFDRVLDTKGGIRKLQAQFEALNVRDAEASNKKDEEMIKFLICDKIGFVKLNETVKSCLSDWLGEKFRYKVCRTRR